MQSYTGLRNATSMPIDAGRTDSLAVDSRTVTSHHACTLLSDQTKVPLCSRTEPVRTFWCSKDDFNFAAGPQRPHRRSALLHRLLFTHRLSHFRSAF